MSGSAQERAVVEAQLGRTPRDPWRVGVRCFHGFPQVIVSPSLLADGSPYPTYAWLTCPWLVEQVGAIESAGGVSAFNERVREEPQLAAALRELDARLREARRIESGGVDACERVGIAGQRDPLGVKCLHAHVAMELVGLDDPIGRELLGNTGASCDDARCRHLVGGAEEDER